MELSERRGKILSAVVDKHVHTAQPVSSKSVAQEYRLGISPATVRIEFAALEKMNLIYQPHTSAGRVPSDRGYRVYVDELLALPPVLARHRHAIDETLSLRHAEVEDLLHAVCRMLCSLTGYVGLVLSPFSEQDKLKSLQLNPVQTRQVLVMVITSEGYVDHKVFHLTEPVPAHRLHTITNFLRHKLKGKKLAEIKQMSLAEICNPKELADEFLPTAFELVRQTVTLRSDEQVFIEGLIYVLNEPEFQDVERTRQLLEFFEQPAHASDLLQPTAEGEQGLRIAIGEEHTFPALHECSLIAATYRVGNRWVGTIAALGPKRMRYGETASLVGYTAQRLSETMNALAG